MKDVWDYLKGLFQKEKESSASNPFLHEQLERTQEEKLAFETWKGSLSHRRMVDWLGDQYAIWEVLPDDIDPAIDFLDAASAKGFAIHLYKTDYPKSETTYLFEFLKEQVLQLNYKSQFSDIRSWSQKTWVETVERHYLKPRTFMEDANKINQRFGNITIELSFRNDDPHHLKFRATGYSDRLYAEAGNFKDLMQAILSSK